MSGCFILITIHVGACVDVAYAPLERGVGTERLHRGVWVCEACEVSP
jgi:hypothetical protein